MSLRDTDLEYIKKYLPSDEFLWGKTLLENGVSPQYIVGNVNFYGNNINVNPNVLIPRFETELLVEKAIGYIRNIYSLQEISTLRGLDIGTGSGCIAISVKKELNCQVVAVDISSEALDVACVNAKENLVDIEFLNSDIFSNVHGKFDFIISNPPYIRDDEDIEDIVKNNEPHLALYAGENGLYFYHKILRECSLYLKDKFFIAFEIGCEQADDIKRLVYQYLEDVEFRIEKDYSNRDRFVFIFRS